MNSNSHKKQAEALIMEVNKLRSQKPVYWMDNAKILIDLAQTHATLATIGEDYE